MDQFPFCIPQFQGPRCVMIRRCPIPTPDNFPRGIPIQPQPADPANPWFKPPAANTQIQPPTTLKSNDTEQLAEALFARAADNEPIQSLMFVCHKAYQSNCVEDFTTAVLKKIHNSSPQIKFAVTFAYMRTFGKILCPVGTQV